MACGERPGHAIARTDNDSIAARQLAAAAVRRGHLVATEKQLRRWRELGFDRDAALEAVRIEDTELCGGDGRPRQTTRRITVQILRAAMKERKEEAQALRDRLKVTADFPPR